MNKIYLNEFKNKGDNKYLRIELNEYYVFFKEYRIDKQVKFKLYKNKPSITPRKYYFPRLKYVNIIDIDDFLLVGFCAFIINNKVLDFQDLWVTPSFRGNKIGTFLIKYFLQTYFPDNDYNEIRCEARSFEGKKLCEKLGFEKDNDYDKDEPWNMILENPNRITFQKECNLNKVTEKTINKFPKKEDFLKDIC